MFYLKRDITVLSVSVLTTEQKVIVAPCLFDELSRVLILSPWFEQQEGITDPGKMVESP